MLLEIGRIFICAKGERDLEALDHWEDELAGAYWHCQCAIPGSRWPGLSGRCV